MVISCNYLFSFPGSREDWCFLCEFQLLMLKGRESNSPLRPTRILSEIRKIGGHLSPGSEEDAHEFLRSLLLNRVLLIFII